MARMTISIGRGRGSRHRIASTQNMTPTKAELFNAVAGAFQLQAPININLDNFYDALSKIIKEEVLNNLYGRRNPTGKWKKPSEERMHRRRIMRAWTGEKAVPITATNPYTDAVVRAVKKGKMSVSSEGRFSVSFETRSLFRDMLNKGWNGERRAVNEALTEIEASSLQGIVIPSQVVKPKYTDKKRKLIVPETNPAEAHGFIVGKKQIQRNTGDYSNRYGIKFVDAVHLPTIKMSPRAFVWVNDDMRRRIVDLFKTGQYRTRKV